MTSIEESLSQIAKVSCPHEMSYRWHLIVPELKTRNIKFEIVDVDSYYDQTLLDKVFAQKRLALVEKDFHKASLFRKQERRLLQALGYDQEKLVYQDSGFILFGYIVKAYLTSSAKNRLLLNLISSYNDDVNQL